MKAEDFKPCSFCGKGMMHSGIPLFYRLTVEHMGIDVREVQRVSGMEQFMGSNVALARVFHDPEVAKRVGEQHTALVCQSCALEPHMLAGLIQDEGRSDAAFAGFRQGEQMSKYTAGTVLVVETGEYSDRSWHGPFRVLKDFDMREVAEEFKGAFKPEYAGDRADPFGLVAHIERAGYAEPIECQTVHVGSYGDIEIDS